MVRPKNIYYRHEIMDETISKLLIQGRVNNLRMPTLSTVALDSLDV